jgi:phage major head subunit gpT-like protein
MLLTPASLQFAFNAFDLRLQQGYTMAASFYAALASEVPSNTEQNVYGWIGKLPKMREWLGERYMNNPAARSYTIVNKTYEDTIKIPREKFEDDQYGIYMPAIELLGQEAKVLPDRLIANLLDTGDAAASIGFDGQSFFSANHPTDPDNAASAVQSNLVTASPLTAANVQKVYAQMRNFTGEDGLPLGIRPTHLVVSPAHELDAGQLCEMEFIAPAGAQFGLNAASVVQSNVLKGKLKPLVVEWLDQSTANKKDTWYLIDASKPVKPFIWQMRRPLASTYLNNLTDANVFLRKEFIYGVDERAAAGYGLWFMATKVLPV